MATVLDLGFLKIFDVIFAFLLLWSIVFAVLQKTKAVSEQMGINATIAAAVGLLAVLSRKLVAVLVFAVPWFAVAIIFLVLIIMIFQLFGVTDVSGAVKDRTVQWSLIGIGLLIIGASFANVFGQELLQDVAGAQAEGTTAEAAGSAGTTADFQQNLFSTLLHPKVLGAIVLFIVAIFAVILLSQG